MDTKLAQQHDDVYAAVFSLVGQKPNETYEGLVKVLPSIKDAGPAEVKELEAKKALRDMLKPQVDPLRLEYEKAAAEDDVDDLSTEEGDWLDNSKGGEDDEALDENGIPVMKLSRASSSFILDGPGDVKVDNFTPEGDPLCDGSAESGGGAANAATATANGAVGPADAAAASGGAAAPTPEYIPSAIARARRESGPGGAAATGAAAPAAPAAPVVTLEDEIRAMRAGSLGRAQQQQHHQHHQAEGANGDTGRRVTDDDDSPEVVPEPPGGLLIAPGPGPGDGGAGAGEARGAAAAAAAASAGAVTAPLGGPGLVPSSRDMAAAATGAAGAGAGATDLPGTCLDTRHEDSLWAAMQGVDGRALLEHLGLAGPSSASVEDLSPGQSAEQSTGEQGQGAEAEGSSKSASDGSAAAAASEAPPPAEAPKPARANGHVVGGPSAPAAVAASRSGSGEGKGGAAGAEAAATEAAGRELALRGPTAASGGGAAGPVASPSGDGPTFETVESFRLDPDFDYDNVKLSVREFPYSMMSVPRVPR